MLRVRTWRHAERDGRLPRLTKYLHFRAFHRKIMAPANALMGAMVMRAVVVLLLTIIPIETAAAQDGKTFTNTLGMKFVRIEAGTFMMGAGATPPTSRAEWTQRD